MEPRGRFRSAGWRAADLGGERHDARPQRLGENEAIARPSPGVGHDPLGMHQSGDGEAGLDLPIVDAVSADNGHARLGHLIDAAAKNLVQSLFRRGMDGKADDRQRRDGPPTHGIHVAEGIGRRDLPENVRIVGRGREDIDGLHEGQIVGQPVHSGIVAGRRADQHPRIVEEGQPLEHAVERCLIDFRGATGAWHQVHEF